MGSIAKKCDLKQAAMQQLLTGHQRLPGFSGEWRYKEGWGNSDRGSGAAILAKANDDFGGWLRIGTSSS